MRAAMYYRKLLTVILVAATTCTAFGFAFFPDEAIAATCPNGQPPIDQGTGLSQICVAAVGANNTCPTGYQGPVPAGTGGFQCTATPTPGPGDPPPSSRSVVLNECNSWHGGWLSAPCWIHWGAVALGAAIVSALTVIPWMAEKLLQAVVDRTVLLSGFSAMYATIGQSVELGWSFVRDLANIAIIGVFVFIAIGIILGLKEYGQKKLIAKVLVVAILINFSFLFTRIIINFSNALSTNLYQRLIVNESGVATGVGSRLLYHLRIANANNNGNVWNGFADSNNAHGLGGLFFHVVVSAIVAVVAGVLILYIAFLLIIRFIVLILLLLTSSAAFAAYLLPSTNHIWSKWWNMLFKNAFLAPILFIALWMAVQVSASVSTALCGDPRTVTTLCRAGDLSPRIGDAGPGINFFLNYIIVLGIIFAGVYIANSFSTALGRRFAVNMTAAPFTLGARFGLAPITRRIMRGGKYGVDDQNYYAGEAKKAREARDKHLQDHAMTGDHNALRLAHQQGALAAEFAKKAQKAGERGKRNYNLADAGFMQKGLSALGVGGAFLGSSGKGKTIADQLKVRAEAAAAISPKSSPADQAAIRSTAERAEEDRRKDSKRALDMAKDQNRQQQQLMRTLHQQTVANQNAKGASEAATRAAAAASGSDKQEKDKAARVAEQAAREAHEKLQKTLTDNPALALKFEGLENGVTAELTQALQDANRAYDDSVKALEEHASAVKKVGDKAVENVQKMDEQIAQQVARGGLFTRTVTAIKGQTAALDEAVLKKVRGSRSAQATLASAMKETAEPAPAAPAAPAGDAH